MSCASKTQGRKRTRSPSWRFCRGRRCRSRLASGVSSENPPYSRLQLPRIAEPGTDRSVEVQERACGGVLEVVGVGDVEDLHHGFEATAGTGRERTRNAKI